MSDRCFLSLCDLGSAGDTTSPSHNASRVLRWLVMLIVQRAKPKRGMRRGLLAVISPLNQLPSTLIFDFFFFSFFISDVESSRFLFVFFFFRNAFTYELCVSKGLCS